MQKVSVLIVVNNRSSLLALSFIMSTPTKSALDLLSLEIWFYIAETSAAAWVALVSTVKEIGLYSLDPNVQDRMKSRFVVRSIESADPFYETPNGYVYYATLPCGKLHSVKCSRDDFLQHLAQLTGWNIDALTPMRPYLHECVQPALIVIEETKKPFYIKWFYLSNKHSFDNHPSFIRFDYDDNEMHKSWYKMGARHRDNDLPAEIHSDLTGKKIIHEEWLFEGEYYRKPPKPQACYYGENGGIVKSHWKIGPLANPDNEVIKTLTTLMTNILRTKTDVECKQERHYNFVSLVVKRWYDPRLPVEIPIDEFVTLSSQQ